MIGICRKTGQTLTGWELYVSHFSDVMTTQLGSREKRRGVGSRIPELRGRNNGPNAAMLARAYTAQAYENPANGLKKDFSLKKIDVQQRANGFLIRVSGLYQGLSRTIEV